MAYNYEDALYDDIKQYLEGNFSDSEDREYLCKDLWIADSVTGNGSGSYTFSRAQAKEYVCDNIELLVEALDEYGVLEELGKKIKDSDWEYLDVTIRCYLLGGILDKVLEETDYSGLKK